MKYEEVMIGLKQGKYASAYLLCGKEPYYIDKVADYIEQNVLDEMAREFDQTIIYGKDLAGGDVAPVIGAARGFAMMGGNKVIIVKEAQNIKKWEALAMYMDNPQPSTILVFCYKYGSPDKRLNLFKNWEKKGGVLMESEQLRDYQVEKWIRDYVAERNKELKALGDEVQIDEKVAKILADSLGTDLTQIVSSLQKLIDGRPEGVKVIDAALVERNVGISKDFNVFELQSALIAGDVVKANRITQYFATSKDHPMVKELGVLYGFFANLMIYHYLPDKSGDPPSEAALCSEGSLGSGELVGHAAVLRPAVPRPPQPGAAGCSAEHGRRLASLVQEMLGAALLAASWGREPGALGVRLSLGVSVSPASMGVRVMDTSWVARRGSSAGRKASCAPPAMQPPAPPAELAPPLPSPLPEQSPEGPMVPALSPSGLGLQPAAERTR